MNKTAFLSVVYPGCEKFLTDFLQSLAAQTANCFDLYLFNDGLVDLCRWTDDWTGEEIHVVDVAGTPAKIRQYAINYLYDRGYDFLIFGDSDDMFSKNRVEESLIGLLDHDVVVNDLDIIDELGSNVKSGYLSARLGDEKNIKPNDILEKNFMGLSNTAINLKKINKVSFPCELIAVDWYFYSCLLMSGAKAAFISKASTLYRQHGENTAGVNELTVESFVRSVSIKKIHYMNMLEIDGEKYSSLYEQYRDLDLKLADAQSKEHCFKRALDNQPSTPLWWEGV